jgi:hypothetical protein
MPRLLAALTILACACVPAAPASASPRLWATVNVCDTETAPDSMGVRAGMSGPGAQRMYMRFRAEHWNRARQTWVPVPGTGTSPWVYAGEGGDPRQAGWTFSFAEPEAGATFTMRAVVEFEWRAAVRRRAKPRAAKRVRVLRRATRVTETGILGVERGDPPGTSKALCLVA